MRTNRYLVVDLMNGGDLRFHISRKTFTEEAVRFWISELGCALRYIHGQGIIHRDVKPDNVLLDSDGHVHLTDFVRPCAPEQLGSVLTKLSRTSHPTSYLARRYPASPGRLPILRRRCMQERVTMFVRIGGPWACSSTSASITRSVLVPIRPAILMVSPC